MIRLRDLVEHKYPAEPPTVCTGSCPSSLAFYSCPSGRDNFKAVRRLVILKFYSALCLQNLWFDVEEAISDFRLRCGRFYPWEISLYFLKILNWSDQSLQGKCGRFLP